MTAPAKAPPPNPWAPHTWPMPAPVVSPGVRAIHTEDDEEVVVGWIEGESPGSGRVGAWLDAQKRKGKRILVVEPMNPRLVGMLERRGFDWGQKRRSPAYNEHVKVMEWTP